MTRLALITGASRGLGAALAETLSPTHHIVAVGRTVGALEALDDRIKAKGGSATLAPMDIAVEAAMQQLCRSIHDRWGKLDLFIHAAVHAPPLAPASHMDEKDWSQTVRINVHATGRLIPLIAPLLNPAAAPAALFFDDPHPDEKFFGPYAASKAAQITLARAWAAEHRKFGPRVIIDTPAPMPTTTRARFFPGEDRTKLTDPHAEAMRIVNSYALV
ncbi:MAG: SDR family NAD(P)-dependent oxidoreductase [Pseudomonadota bacterium]